MITEHIRRNIRSGVTISLVSIPLSVSLAVASNATPLVGIITAIWAGLVTSLFGGSNFNIVGPTGALSGIVATYVLANGMGSLPALTIVAGAMILAAYALRLERYLILIPSSVIHGFTLGVAVIIGASQLNAALGLSSLPAHESFFANTVESIRHAAEVSSSALAVFVTFFAGLLLFKKFAPRVPGAIILTPVGIGLGYGSEIGALPFALQTLGTKFGAVTFTFFQAHRWDVSAAMLHTAAVIALIAILETMLSAKIADGMTKTRHNERKEMFGLGLANIVSGLIGGMPATAALARTSLNIKTGASHKTSATINALGIALISVFFLSSFTYLPLPVIAAILVFVAVQMVEAEHYVKFWRYERTGFFVSLIVAVATVIVDPVIGILAGTSVSLLIFVDRLSHGYFDARLNKFDEGIVGAVAGDTLKEIEEDADVLLYSIRGKLCYLNSRAHLTRFEENLEKYKHVILRLREVYFIDTDGVEALDEIIDIVQSRGQQALISSVDPSILPLLEELSPKYRELKDRGLIFQKTELALQHLGVPIRQEWKE